MSGRVIVVDDDLAMAEAMRDELTLRGHTVVAHTRADQAFAQIADGQCDVVVTDLRMRGISGIDLCGRVVANRPDVPVIVVTAFGSMDTAVATLRAGAFDFLTKPFSMEDLAVVVERGLHHKRLREEVRQLAETAKPSGSYVEELVGKSAVMLEVHDLVTRLASSDATLLVTGETGTGKELVARAIHRRSRRAHAPLVSINCGALPDNLLESELFGHVRGAFTDARTDKKGLMAQADGGTLFLDEIGEMAPAMQVKLLRAVESRLVRPLGSAVEVPFDVRIIAATHRDLPAAIERGTFREDLYYRINVVQLELPPLRHRGKDVLLLAQGFIESFARQYDKAVARLSAAAAERLLAYGWPGNVRELRNVIERAVALARYEELVVEDLPVAIREYARASVAPAHDLPPDQAELASLARVEREHIERVLAAVGGNKRRAAQILGLDRVTLYRRLERYAQPAKK